MDELTTEITFFQASEIPNPEDQDADFLLLNPCDGYHLATALFVDGEFNGFYPWGMEEEYLPDEFYIAWAKLPDSVREVTPVFKHD